MPAIPPYLTSTLPPFPRAHVTAKDNTPRLLHVHTTQPHARPHVSLGLSPRPFRRERERETQMCFHRFRLNFDCTTKREASTHTQTHIFEVSCIVCQDAQADSGNQYSQSSCDAIQACDSADRQRATTLRWSTCERDWIALLASPAVWFDTVALAASFAHSKQSVQKWQIRAHARSGNIAVCWNSACRAEQFRGWKHTTMETDLRLSSILLAWPFWSNSRAKQLGQEARATSGYSRSSQDIQLALTQTLQGCHDRDEERLFCWPCRTHEAAQVDVLVGIAKEISTSCIELLCHKVRRIIHLRIEADHSNKRVTHAVSHVVNNTSDSHKP